MPKTKPAAHTERKCGICGGPGRPYADVCANCHSWWHNHQLQTAAEYGRYVGGVRKAATRIEHKGATRHSNIRRVK